MKSKLIIIVAIIVVGIAFLFGRWVWTSRNTAKSEADTVLEGLASSTSSQWYCENGAGKGIDNQTPWWEEIYVSNVNSEETAKIVEEYLKDKNYPVTSKYIEDSQDSYNKGKTYWEIEGKQGIYTVQAKVSSKELTLNNCFKDFSNMDENINPESYNSVIVVQFKSES